MKRLSYVNLVSSNLMRRGDSTQLAGSPPSSGLLCSMSATTSSLVEQKCALRNLHQYPKARYKSHVKDTQRFSRNWWLSAGNNHELVEDYGHEREATENFGELRNDSDRDKFLLSTQRLQDLPPAQRLDALTALMTMRFGVKDGDRGFDKAKLLLQSLECFSEMRLSGQIKVFAELPEPDQDTFLQYVEGCVKYAQAGSHSHPEAVAVMLRAAQICDEMCCTDKREELTRMAELAAERMDRAYAFRRKSEGISLNKPNMTETLAAVSHRDRTTLAERFKKTPWLLEERKRTEYMLSANRKKVWFTPMKASDPQTRMNQLHAHRIEE